MPPFTMPFVSAYSEEQCKAVQASVKASAGYPESDGSLSYTTFETPSHDSDETVDRFISVLPAHMLPADIDITKMVGVYEQHGAMIKAYTKAAELFSSSKKSDAVPVDSLESPSSEKIQNSSSVDVNRAELDDRLELLGAKLEERIGQAIDAMKAHDEARGLSKHESAGLEQNLPMTEVTRVELDAKLDSVRAEVRASIAESSKETVVAMGQLNTQMATLQGQMLGEMQGLRASFATMLQEVTREMAATNVSVAQLGEKVSGVGGKVEGLEGKVDGLKSSISMLQTVIGYAIGIAGVIAAAFAIGVAWMQLDFAQKTTQPPSAPILTAPVGSAPSTAAPQVNSSASLEQGSKR